MGLISHAAAVGLGFALARPEGRRQLLKIRDQARRLLQQPQVTRLQDQGRDLVTQQISAGTTALKEKLGRGTPSTSFPAPGAETVDPAIPGLPLPRPSPAARTTTPTPPAGG